MFLMEHSFEEETATRITASMGSYASEDTWLPTLRAMVNTIKAPSVLQSDPLHFNLAEVGLWLNLQGSPELGAQTRQDLAGTRSGGKVTNATKAKWRMVVQEALRGTEDIPNWKIFQRGSQKLYGAWRPLPMRPALMHQP